MSSRIHWQYYFARKFSLQRFEIVARTLASDFYQKDFGVNVKNILIKPEEGGNHAIWLEPREWDRSVQKIFRSVCKDLPTFYHYKQLIKRTQRAWVAAARSVGQKTSSKLSAAGIAKLYDHFIHHHQEHFNKPIWIPFPIESTLAKHAEAALVSVLRRAKRMEEYEHWFSVVFSPEEKNAVTQMQEALLHLAAQIKRHALTRKARAAALERIAKVFGFIPCYDVIDAPWQSDHFASELSALLKKPLAELEAESRDLRDRFPKRRDEFRVFLRKFPMRHRQRELLVMAHELVFIKDERDDYRRMGCKAGRPLFAEIGRRLGLTLREASYLSIEETKDYLHRGVAPPPIQEVQSRVRGYLILKKHGQPMIFESGKRMESILQQELGNEIAKKASEVRGAVGSPGHASGVAVVVRTKHDLRRVTDGAIMIAVTTNPDYVPAMRKCKAIVTDEGGITSHAAIVARELKIPCIVGTKNATHTFKEGDRVAVDAEHGVVHRL